jgi:adenosylcobinamide-GDP ribazoletransferase
MPFLAALEFLTRLRVRRVPRTDMRSIAAAQMWFPAVGLLIGALLLAIDRLASRALPAASADVIVVVALAMITGGLHLDGLADAADGVFGGDTPERRLEIMRDVHAGTYAIVAVVAVLALKWAGLAAMPTSVRFEALLLVPCLARLAMVAGAAAYPYARPDGMGAGFRAHARRALPVAGATAFTASMLLIGAGGLLVTAFAVTAALAVGACATRAAGGMTGDLYGATAEISEALLLLVIAAMANRGWIDAWLLR